MRIDELDKLRELDERIEHLDELDESDLWWIASVPGICLVTAHFADNWEIRSYVIHAMTLEVVLNDENEIAHENTSTLLKFLNGTMEEFQVC